MPLIVALVAGVLAALLTAAVVHRFPAFDPAAPRVAPKTITKVAKQPAAAGFLRSRLDPETITGFLLTGALVLAIGGGVAVGALFVMVEHNAFLAHYDLSAAQWGATNATAMSTHALKNISQLGGTLVIVLVSVAVAAVELARTRSRAVVWFVLAVVLGQTLVMNLIKYIVDRPRPDIAQLTGFSGSSFPSGHATAAAATYAAAAFLIGRGRSRPTKAWLAAGAAGIATAVATTRVLLGVHWLTDVLAGLALGWSWFAVCSIAFGGRVLRFGQPVEIAEIAADQATAAGKNP